MLKARGEQVSALEAKQGERFHEKRKPDFSQC